MNVDKQTIAKGIVLIAQTYDNYKKHLEENGGLQQLTENWYDILQVVEDDYQEAKEDFTTAVKVSIANNKYPPTIKEVLDTMKLVKDRREKNKEVKHKYNFLNLIQDYPFFRINTGVELEEAYETYKRKGYSDDLVKKAIKNYTLILEIKHEKPTKPINLFFKDLEEYTKKK